MKRRDLVQKIFVGGATLIVMPSVLTSCQKDPAENMNNNNTPPPGTKVTVDMGLAMYAGLKNTGASAVVQGIIVANTGSGYIALESTCTHLGCTIGYNLVSNNFPCPCHGSVFSTSGSVVNGPATVALKTYPVSISGDVLTISV